MDWKSRLREFRILFVDISVKWLLFMGLFLLGAALHKSYGEPLAMPLGRPAEPIELILLNFTPRNVFFFLPAALYFLSVFAPGRDLFRKILKSLVPQPSFYGDVQMRALNSQIEQIERRIGDELRQHLDRELLNVASGENIVNRMLDRRLKDGLLVTVDDALLERTSPVGRKIRVHDLLADVSDRLRLKYDGPAARAEWSATWSRRLSYALAITGLLVATVRVITSSGFTDAIMALIKENKAEHFWPLVFAQAAPWVGLVVLIEFTALIFFKFYVRSIELQRYFTRELANSEGRFGALRVITEVGTPEQSVSAALALMALQENSLRSDFANDDVKQAGAVGDLLDKVKGFLPSKSA